MLQITSETSTSRRIQKARTALVLDHPFFGSLLFRLKDLECGSIETMATDGVSLYYNPEFVETLIVTDHADLKTEWFAASVIARWRGHEKLVPEEWYTAPS